MLKLTKLPNRETAKISFTASVELKSALDDYAEILSKYLWNKRRRRGPYSFHDRSVYQC